MSQEELLIATVVAGWKLTNGRANKVIAGYTDAQLEKQVAPERNRVRYLVGHLTAVNDRMFEALGIGPRLHPELDETYISNPDRALPDPVSTEELKAAWAEVSEKLTAAFETFTPAQWLERHSAVSPEDFVKEPLRNRLAMVLSRTNHIAMHLGQAILAK